MIDLSSPEGHSINDGINANMCSLEYVSVDSAADLLKKGQGALITKVDIRSAYRNVPVHPDDRWLLAMSWEDEVFIDTALPFGLRSAPKIFNALADGVEWILREAGVSSVIHYLDDFLLVENPASPECSQSLRTMLQVFEELGLPIALDKLEGPVTHLTFLGFELDSFQMDLRLPADKLSSLMALIASWLVRRSCTRKELESVVGERSYPQARPFSAVCMS